MAASKKRFVESTCEVVVWGPVDVANNTTITQQTLLYLEHPELLMALQLAEAQAKTHAPPDESRFRVKFDTLAEIAPDETATIDELRATFRQAWSKSIILNQTLADTQTDLHRQFDGIRKTAATSARLASLKSGIDPFALIQESVDHLKNSMDQLVAGGLPAQVRDDLAEAETGRLIGECPLNFRVVKK